MKYTIKNVIENDYVWIITKVMQGYNGKIRIDAKTRFHIADESNFFSEWCTKKICRQYIYEQMGKTNSNYKLLKLESELLPAIKEKADFLFPEGKSLFGDDVDIKKENDMNDDDFIKRHIEIQKHSSFITGALFVCHLLNNYNEGIK